MSPPDNTRSNDAIPGAADGAPDQVEQKAKANEDAKSERGNLAQDQATERAVEKRENLKDEIYDFNDEEKAKYKRAFGKDLEPVVLTSLTIDEVDAAEIKEPGITKVLFKKVQKDNKKETFTAHNNHDIEWSKGLKDLVDENVSEITLNIHPKNLIKGGNQAIFENNQTAKDALAAYHENPPRVVYFERKSTKRENGNFYNDDGYMRIFDGDTWSIDRKMTPEELETAKQQPHNEVTMPSGQTPTASPVQEQQQGSIDVAKPKSIDSALESYGNTFIDECEKQDVPQKLIKFMYALAHAESKWSMRADNPNSSASGIGQLLDSTSRAMHRGLVKAGRKDIPQDTEEFMRKMKTDARLQIAAFVRLVKSEAKAVGSKIPQHNPMNNLDEIGMAFMALTHHEGQGGVNGYIRWWRDQGSPNTIPKFPDQETASRYLTAKHQRRRSLNGREGTNKLIDWVHNIARAAGTYEVKVTNFIAEKRALAKGPTSEAEPKS